MTTLIVTVTALLVLAAIQCVGGSDARGATRQLVSNRAGHAPAPIDVLRVARSTELRTHVARLP